MADLAEDPTLATVPPSKGPEAAPGRRCPTCGGAFPGDFVVCPRDATPLVSADAEADALVGVVLGGTYRIARLLGAGGMGRVYEAEHTRLERRFAVKVIRESFAQVADAVARFEREARAASRVRSEHVLQVVDVLRTPDGRPCIVTDLLEGTDLQTYLDEVKKLSPAEAVPVVRQICRGLAEAHAAGVIHRDLKPSNVFLCARSDGSRVAKILDFGVAKLAGDADLTVTGAVLGTPAYMAPEQARGASTVDARADVYAAGAVLYRMLAGRPPYGGGSTGDTTNPLARLLHEDPPRPRSVEPSIPDGLEALIQEAMARDPAARPASARALDERLALFDRTSAPGAGTGPAAAASAAVSAAAAVRVADAAELTRRARRARPRGVALVAATTALTALAAAVLLGGLVAAFGRGRPTLAERILVVLFAGGGGLGALVGGGRALRRAWSSTPSVEALAGRLGRGLRASVGTFGTLELALRGWGSLAGAAPPLGPGAAALRVALAVLAGVYFLRRR